MRAPPHDGTALGSRSGGDAPPLRVPRTHRSRDSYVLIALALAAGFVVWLIVRGDDNESSGAPTTTQTATEPEIGPVPQRGH